MKIKVLNKYLSACKHFKCFCRNSSMTQITKKIKERERERTQFRIAVFSRITAVCIIRFGFPIFTYVSIFTIHHLTQFINSGFFCFLFWLRCWCCSFTLFKYSKLNEQRGQKTRRNASLWLFVFSRAMFYLHSLFWFFFSFHLIRLLSMMILESADLSSAMINSRNFALRLQKKNRPKKQKNQMRKKKITVILGWNFIQLVNICCWEVRFWSDWLFSGCMKICSFTIATLRRWEDGLFCQIAHFRFR